MFRFFSIIALACMLLTSTGLNKALAVMAMDAAGPTMIEASLQPAEPSAKGQTEIKAEKTGDHCCHKHLFDLQTKKSCQVSAITAGMIDPEPSDAWLEIALFSEHRYPNGVNGTGLERPPKFS